jgi:hypothetical protein
VTTKFVGQVIAGGCVSTTVTVNMQEFVLPLASVATFVTVVTPRGNVLPLDGTLVKFVTPQLSAAPTVQVTLLRLHRPRSAAKTRFVGQVIPGGSLSRTVTVKVQWLKFPLASAAKLVTVVVPTGNVLPLGGMLARFVTAQLSVAPTVHVTLLRLH